MSHRNRAGVLLLIMILIGGGALLTVRFTQGQEPDATGASEAALGTGFTYQGKLSHDGAPVGDSCDFTFALFADANGDDQVGTTETVHGVDVVDGRFTVLLNDAGQFGPDAFDGEARWLDIAVQCPGDGAFTQLGLQPLTAAPQAQYALNAGTAASVPWSGITGVPDSVTQGVPFANVVVVAQSGGDFDAIQAALDSIDDASDANRYLIWIAPGVYDEQVTMKPFVDIEGAGQNMITIRSTGGSENPVNGPASATVRAASNSELRRLTVESDGDGQPYAVAIDVRNVDDSFHLRDVTAVATDPGINNRGIYIDNASPVVNSATISVTSSVTNYGIYNRDGSPLINDVTISVSGDTHNRGIFNAGATAIINRATITVAGPQQSQHGILNSAAPSVQMNDIDISVSGGIAVSSGVFDNQSTSTITNLTVSASGSTSYGLRQVDSTSAVYHSRLKGDTNSIHKIGGAISVSSSELDGPISNSGAMSCVYSHDADLNELTSNCTQ